ncbi:energy-coupling factor transporter transmembrane component T family protein [Mesomycoplasma lagogenitalium]|uniref:Energy-coupling factor transporter transmembrane protein EcfT n=1 Tax=Mesomycoplasma lagogenitalium TaxID=171286 RepID=A0ABY8LUJ3_9BACT|nr:energy-coupling factor transporter transmembrane protein EcfT [Mesomycoplasma lagogenitalium]WGI36906.1 energy-coupling factor transporter transmembrane protein EcfT [Mesomycoplasma lagogenitalium]
MNIVVGKYVPKNTFLHRLDPRLKLIFNILFIIFFFVVTHLFTLSFLIIPTLIIFILTTERPLHLLKMAKLPIFIFLFMSVLYGFLLYDTSSLKENENFIINGFSINDKKQAHLDSFNFVDTEWFSFEIYFKFRYTNLVFIRSFVLGLRIYCMLIITTLLIYTTKPILLTKAIEDLISPLKLIKINTSVIAMIISISIRFIPTLLLEANRIIKAQASRGVDFKHGKIKDKVKSMITLTIPLFVLSFSRAEDLANAMEVRGYVPYEKRTRYRRLYLKWFDYLFMLFLVAFIIFVILIEQNVFGQLPQFWLYTAQLF